MLKKIEKITKPTQLLAAIFLGLISVNTLFLTSASNLTDFPWFVGILVLASVVNVYIFLFYSFKLQTEYRPQMQDDEYYAKYLLKTDPITGRESEKENFKVEDRSEETGSVNVNKLLKNYDEIRLIFDKNNIKIDKIFGGNTEEKTKELGFGIPPINLITYGFGFSMEQFQTILRLLRDSKAEDMYISYSIHAINKNKIYIGSYAYKSTKNYIKLSEDIMQKLLKKDTSHFGIEKILKIGSIEQITNRTIKKTPSTTYIAV